jgi:hypothetical protein
MKIEFTAIKQKDIWVFDHPHNNTVKEPLCNGTELVLNEYFEIDMDRPAISNDRLDILVSTNGGATWSASLLTIPRYNAAFTTPGWKLFSIPLTIYAGVSCCRIAIRATSAFGNNMAIDYLKVYNTGSILPIKLIKSALSI